MDTALRPLTTGELLDRTLRTYRKHFLLFLGISAVPSLVDLVLKLGLQISLGLGRRDANPVITGLVGLALVLLSFVISAVITAATTFGVSDLLLDRPTSIASCLNRVLPRLFKVVVTSFLYGIIVGLGFILLIFPAFYFLGKYGLSSPAVVLEDIGPTEALSRSSDLTKESILRVLCIWFVAFALVLLVSWTLGAILVGLLATVLKGSGSTVILGLQDVASALSTILVGPVMAIALTMLYYDQRVRKEAFDIENMMQLLERDNPLLAQGAAVS